MCRLSLVLPAGLSRAQMLRSRSKASDSIVGVTKRNRRATMCGDDMMGHSDRHHCCSSDLSLMYMFPSAVVCFLSSRMTDDFTALPHQRNPIICPLTR